MIGDILITRHARERLGQRGITNRFLLDLFSNADAETSVGGGVVAIRVTRERSRALKLDDKLHRYAALIGSDGALVSVVPMQPGKRSRVYRRAA